MCGSMVDIQSPAAEIRRGNKKDRKIDRKIVTTGQKYNVPPISQGGHNNVIVMINMPLLTDFDII